jgi:hypothetical protein
MTDENTTVSPVNPHVTLSAELEEQNQVNAVRTIYTLIALSGLDIEPYQLNRFVDRCESLSELGVYVSFDVRAGGTRCTVTVSLDTPNSYNSMAFSRCDIEKSDGSVWSRLGLRCEANMSSSGSINHVATHELAEALSAISKFLFHVELLNVPNDHPEAVYVCILSAEQKQERAQRAAIRKIEDNLAERVYRHFDGKYPKNAGNIKSIKLADISCDIESVRALKPFTRSPAGNSKITHTFEVLKSAKGFSVFVQKSDKN